MRYPSRLLAAGEEVIDAFRPHWKVLLPAILWAMLLAALSGAALAALPRPWGWGFLGVAAVAWLALSWRRLVAWCFTGYVLTTARVIVRRGMIARNGVEIPLEDVANVRFSQTIAERILRCGDVTLESAGSEPGSTLADIPDPEGFHAEVYAARALRTADLARHRSADTVRELVAQLEALAERREQGHLSDDEFEARKAQLLREVAED